MKPHQLIIWNQGESPLSDLDVLSEEQIDNIKDTVLSNGAVLFRGFGIDSPVRFSRLVSVIGGDTLDYLGGTSPRTRIQENVYTSTDYPPNVSISMHNEQSYSASWPGKLFFCCATPAATGGRTLLCDSAAILAELDPAVRETFKTKGVQYIRNLCDEEGPGLSWKKVFLTDDKSAVEEYCSVNQLTCSWRPDGGVRLVGTRPATAIHPKTGLEVWFNQANLFHPSQHTPEVYDALQELYGEDVLDFPMSVCFGDGELIPDDMLKNIDEVSARHMIPFDWEKGDLLIIDNMLISHGREPFSGERKIFVAMTA